MQNLKTTSNVSLRAGIYCRLSQDRDGDKASIGRQESDARKLSAVQGWTVSEVYIDRDLSAFKEDVVRPAFEQLRADIAAGKLDVAIVWRFDRLSRLHLVSERFHAEARKAGCRVISVMEPSSDDPSSELTRRILSAVAEQEARSISMRVSRASEQRAREGRYHGGGKRLFGYTPDRSAIIPAEAKAIRDAASRVLKGEAIRSILRDWNQRGLLSALERPWTASQIVRMLSNPALAGFRVHRGENVGKAAWKPILDKRTHERLSRILKSPSRRLSNTNTRKYLLSGIVACGECDRPLVSRPWYDYRNEKKPRPRYICNTLTGGCGKVSVFADLVEEIVKAWTIEAVVRSKKLDKALRAATANDAKADSFGEQIEADEAMLLDLSNLYTDRVISRAEWLSQREKIEARLKFAKSEAARASGTDFLASVPRDEKSLIALWERSDLDYRRRLILALLDQVTITRPTTKGGPFDPHRVKIVARR